MSLDFRIRVTELSESARLGRVDQRIASYADWLSDYEGLVRHAQGLRGSDGIEQIMERLPQWVSDERNLWTAWRHLALYGGASPGPNGCTLRGFGQTAMWEQLRSMRDVMRSGRYVPGAARKISIAKASGNGTRDIHVADAQDRVIARGVQQVLRPWLARYSPTNDCSRAGRGPLYAIALAELISRRTRRFVWGVQDLRDAFDQVPRGRLLDVVRGRVSSAPLIDLVRRLIAQPRRRGLPQGSPLSPLLFETYRNHFIDLQWIDSFRRVPLLSYVDDLMVLGHSDESPLSLHAELSRLALTAGFAVKHSSEEMFHDIREEAVNWLGYRCLWRRNRLELRPSRLAFADEGERTVRVRELRDRFISLHQHGNANARVKPLISGLLSYAGAGYPYLDGPETYEAICEAAREAEFTQLPSLTWFESRWRSSFEGWRTIRSRVAALNPPGSSLCYQPETAA